MTDKPAPVHCTAMNESEMPKKPPMSNQAQPSMLDYALAYARRGYAVFPCHAGNLGEVKSGKNPLNGKGGFRQATIDEAQIRDWWGRWPDALIGCPPSSKGMLVVDVDPNEGETCEAVLADLEAEIGCTLPHAPTVITQSGGWHIWLQRKAGVELGNRKMANKRIDIRCDNGYVILPPSTMAWGTFYEWKDGADFAPPMMPDALAEAVAKKETSTASAPPPDHVIAWSDEPGEKAIRRYGQGALDKASAEMANTTKGGRGHALNLHAYSLGKLVGAGALSDREVWASLSSAADASGLTATDGAKERDAKIRRGLDAGKADCGDVQARLKGIADEARERVAKYATCSSRPSSKPAEGNHLPTAKNSRSAVKRAVKGKQPDTSVDAEGVGLSQIPKKYDIDWMNKYFAFVLVGSKGVILVEDDGGNRHENFRLISVEAFQMLFANRVSHINERGFPVTFASKWMTDKSRRTFARGLTFLPDKEGDTSPPGMFNLWRGFSVKASPDGSYDVLKDHLFTNVANGDRAHYDYVYAWLADMVQNPRKRPGVALVFRGKRGVGKSTIGDVVGRLFDANYFLVDDPRYVTGHFNSHLQSTLLLQADEAVWAGDKVAEGRLKGLVTADIQFIERKGIDQIKVDNFVHLIMTSNEDWVVPAGPDERRFAVFDVGDTCAKNRKYFGELYAELENGGYEALLHDLLNYDLTQVDLSNVPKTKALLEQKLVSLDQISSWWFGRLHDGDTLSSLGGWQSFVAKPKLMGDYYLISNKSRPSSYKADEIQFGVKMRKLVPGIKESRKNDVDEDGIQSRKRGFVFPSLQECRDAFCAHVEQEIIWPKEET